ncbi:MAG: tRNA1(Val) (adenine(37)-N6)-methyltransferase [Desulfobacterales bacterium]
MTVWQSLTGYRFSVDAVILAGHVFPRDGDRVLDLGTGCGIIPLILASKFPAVTLWGIELQARLAAVAALNVRDNGLQDRIHIRCRDFRKIHLSCLGRSMDVVVSNPPYRRVASGRINANSQRALARHEIKAKLEDLLSAACRVLGPGGRFMTLYPADRLVDVISAMRAHGIEPKWLRMVHSSAGGKAKLFLVEGLKGARPAMVVAPPLHIYAGKGQYSEEMERMFDP